MDATPRGGEPGTVYLIEPELENTAVGRRRTVRRPRHGPAHGLRACSRRLAGPGARADRGLRAGPYGRGDGPERAGRGRGGRSRPDDPRPDRKGGSRTGGEGMCLAIPGRIVDAGGRQPAVRRRSRWPGCGARSTSTCCARTASQAGRLGAHPRRLRDEQDQRGGRAGADADARHARRGPAGHGGDRGLRFGFDCRAGRSGEPS